MVPRGYNKKIPLGTLNWPQKITEDKILITLCLNTSTREFPETAIEMWLQSMNKEIYKTITRKKMSLNKFTQERRE